MSGKSSKAASEITLADVMGKFEDCMTQTHKKMEEGQKKINDSLQNFSCKVDTLQGEVASMK